MKNMFSAAPWWGSQAGGVQSLGFNPGPLAMPVTNPLLGQPQGFPAPVPPQVTQQQQLASPAAPAPPGAVPMGDKADCPVCRSFGGGF